jgi:hypothetical protein
VGGVHTEETDGKQLVSCGVKIQLRETGAFMPRTIKRKMQTLAFEQLQCVA